MFFCRLDYVMNWSIKCGHHRRIPAVVGLEFARVHPVIVGWSSLKTVSSRSGYLHSRGDRQPKPLLRALRNSLAVTAGYRFTIRDSDYFDDADQEHNSRASTRVKKRLSCRWPYHRTVKSSGKIILPPKVSERQFTGFGGRERTPDGPRFEPRSPHDHWMNSSKPQ